MRPYNLFFSRIRRRSYGNRISKVKYNTVGIRVIKQTLGVCDDALNRPYLGHIIEMHVTIYMYFCEVENYCLI